MFNRLEAIELREHATIRVVRGTARRAAVVVAGDGRGDRTARTTGAEAVIATGVAIGLAKRDASRLADKISVTQTQLADVVSTDTEEAAISTQKQNVSAADGDVTDSPALTD